MLLVQQGVHCVRMRHMAIYHFKVKIIQRSKGQNIIAAAAYRRAARLHDAESGRYFNYTHKPDVIHSALLIPKDAPEWIVDLLTDQQTVMENSHQGSENLWNIVTQGEKRKDSQLAREIEFALPIELDQEQNIALAKAYLEEQFVQRGMLADWSVHWDVGNPHVHVLLTMREIMPEGFGKKVTAWHSKEMIHTWRAQWAEYVNRHLQQQGIDRRIDHRSYKEQGIDLVPGIHQGKAVSDMARRGLMTERMEMAHAIRRENLRRICENPEVILRKITAEYSTFTLHDLGANLGRYINDKDGFSHLEASLIPKTTFVSSRDLPKMIQEETRVKGVLTAELIAKIFTALEHHHAVFSDRELAVAIVPFTDNAELFTRAVLQIKASKEMCYLGTGEDGRDRFTTQNMFNLENKAQSLADHLRYAKHKIISKGQASRILKNFEQCEQIQLKTEQRAAVEYLIAGGSLRCLVGRAGTGKSFTLKAARAVWASQGLQIHGIALSGVAADGLNKEAGIRSQTIEAFRLALKNKTIALDKNTVLVMDEAGMTDTVSMLTVLDAVKQAGSKLVLVGDPAQLQPIGPGAIFRALLERLNYSQLEEVFRQRESWQREATKALAEGEINQAIAAYDQRGYVHMMPHSDQAIHQLVQDWSQTRAQHNTTPLSEFLVIAHRNQDIQRLNTHLRAERKIRGEITQGYSVSSKYGTIQIDQSERILFLKNDARLGVKNGRFATVETIQFTENGRVTEYTVILDGSNKRVTINPDQYQAIDYGYAATVHKDQGVTVDHAFVYAAGGGWNRHLTYVAMTRHRHQCHLYADHESFKNAAVLIKNLSRYSMKDSVLDYPLAFAERRGIDTDTASSKKRLQHHLAARLDKFRKKIIQRYEQVIHPARYQKQSTENAKAKSEAAHRAQRNDDARLVATYIDLQRDIGMAWQVLKDALEKQESLRTIDQPKGFSRMVNASEYGAFQSLLKQRNAVAALLMTEPERYQHAMDQVYGLDRKKLQKQANQYHCDQQVKSNKILKTSVHMHDTLLSTKSEKPFDLTTSLKNYIALEVEKSKLFTIMHQADRERWPDRKIHTDKFFEQDRKLKIFVVEILKQPEVTQRLKNNCMGSPASFAKQTDFTAVQRRMEIEPLSEKEILLVLEQLQRQASQHEKTMQHQQNRDRGGRSR